MYSKTWIFGETQLKNQQPFIKPGTRVVRGPDWNFGYEDNGEGFLGTLVLDEDTDDERVTVIWDSGRKSKYMTNGNQKVLRVYDTSPTGIKHVGISCHFCGENPINGLRWQCAKCKKINLCSFCYMNDRHDINHRFYRFDKPDIKSAHLERRSDSNITKATARGLFIGAEVLRGPNWSYREEDGFDVGYIKEIVAWKGTNIRGAVNVLWKHSEEMTRNRVGAEGCVDVVYSRLTENAIGGSYYPNHLPVVDRALIDTSDEPSIESPLRLDTVENKLSGSHLQTIKCVLVGDKVSGKTEMLISYTTKMYPETYVPTVFDNYHVTLMVGGKVYTLELFDTAGQEEYTRLRPLSYPQTDVFLVCFSVVSPDSFGAITEKWIPEITHFCPNTPFLIVGTEMEKRNDVTTIEELGKKKQKPIRKEQGEQMALSTGAVKYLETSARTHEGLNEVFDEAVLTALSLVPSKSNFNACSVM